MTVREFIVVINDSNNNHIGSGILINFAEKSHSYIFTAKHCLFIKDILRNIHDIKIVWPNRLSVEFNIIEYILSEGDDDVAIIKTEYIDSINTKIGVNKVSNNDIIQVIGYPATFRGIYINHIRGSVLDNSEPFYTLSLDYFYSPYYDTTLKGLLPGVSGSPVVKNDEIIGIYTGTAEGYGINFSCISIKIFLELLIDKNINPILDSFRSYNIVFKGSSLNRINDICKTIKNRIQISPRDIDNQLKEDMSIPKSNYYNCILNYDFWCSWLFILVFYIMINNKNPELSSLSSLNFSSATIDHKGSLYYVERKGHILDIIQNIIEDKGGRFRFLENYCYLITGQEIRGDYISKSQKELIIENISLHNNKLNNIDIVRNNMQFSCINLETIFNKIYTQYSPTCTSVIEFLQNIFLEVLDIAS